ncbi:MAG TPA: NAD(P)H-dependent oxidoreductase [Symbiobacteriaceae bacterium]|nr:NAD(P)H-dependent oxidoreductase [Symbiobacteriaceae bacterium]
MANIDWTILDGFDTDSPIAGEIGALLTRRLEQAGQGHASFKMKEMHLATCRSCGACNYKSPGKCVVQDDLHEILRAAARSRVLVFLTPIRFGGYTSQLKKALEKFMNLGYSYYMMKNGKLLHPMRYGDKSILSIGVIEADVPGQEETFQLHLRRNAQNLLSPHCKAVIVRRDGGGAAQILPGVEEALAW